MLKDGVMYKPIQNNKLHRCVTIEETEIILRELHERVVKNHFVANKTTKKVLDVIYWWPKLFKDVVGFCKIM